MPSTMDKERIITYIGVAAIVLLLFGLGGWYLFLRNETTAIEGEASARGFSVGIPAFLGSRGSTAANTGAEYTGGDGGGSAFARLLGFGQPLEGEKAGEAAGGDSGKSESDRRAPRFWRVTAAPVAGAAFTTGTSSRLRYVERASGHVFDADPRTGDVERVTNTLTPRVYEAMVGNDTVVMRTIEDGSPVTLSGKVGEATDGPAELTLTNLGVDVLDIVATPASDLLLIAAAGTGNHLIRAAWDGSAPKQLLAIRGGDFRIQVAGSDIVLVERTGSGIPGSAFRASASLEALVGNILGLSLKAQPGSNNLLYSSDDGTRLRLFAKRGSSSDAEIALATTAEKCVWGSGETAYCAAPRGTIPGLFHDRWYRGEIHTEDSWYTVDAGGGKAATLFTIESGAGIDVENPVIDPSHEYLAFQNARDKSLWMLRIEE
jgi:hypothetical protein